MDLQNPMRQTLQKTLSKISSPCLRPWLRSHTAPRFFRFYAKEFWHHLSATVPLSIAQCQLACLFLFRFQEQQADYSTVLNSGIIGLMWKLCLWQAQ
ncbi:hypothetical protein ABKV19_024862 [Rosa sericea]